MTTSRHGRLTGAGRTRDTDQDASSSPPSTHQPDEELHHTSWQDGPRVPDPGCAGDWSVPSTSPRDSRHNKQSTPTVCLSHTPAWRGEGGIGTETAICFQHAGPGRQEWKFPVWEPRAVNLKDRKPPRRKQATLHKYETRSQDQLQLGGISNQDGGLNDHVIWNQRHPVKRGGAPADGCRPGQPTKHAAEGRAALPKGHMQIHKRPTCPLPVDSQSPQGYFPRVNMRISLNSVS